MLHQLPAETTLHVMSYMPLQSLYSIAFVSRQWNVLIMTNASTVYRNAAILHRFIDEDQPAGGDAIGTDWKKYCQRQLEIENGWRGKAPSVVRNLTELGLSVDRIKVDHTHGFIIKASDSRGLLVCDAKTNANLWALPSLFAAQLNPHSLEYDHGYIVFARSSNDGGGEVWRHIIDAPDILHSKTSPPDEDMLYSQTEAYPSAGHRGHFKPWALLDIPENYRVLRLSYPDLLVVTPNRAYVWDITRSQLVLEIPDIQQQRDNFIMSNITCAEVNDVYVFICGHVRLRIFARENGVLLYQLPSKVSGAIWDVRPSEIGGKAYPESIVHPQILLHNTSSSNVLNYMFKACHVSASGHDLALLATRGKLILLPGFQRLFTEPNSVRHQEIVLILNFQQSLTEEDTSFRLAMGHRNGKLAISTDKGVYLISPDLDFSRLTADRPPEPGLSVCQLDRIDDTEPHLFMPSLQITHDAVYFSQWETFEKEEGYTSIMYNVSF